MMTPDMLYEGIRNKQINIIHQVDYLKNISQADYDSIVIRLLDHACQPDAENVTHEYLDQYYCQVRGCILFAFRPNQQLYPNVLHGSLKIADPSSCYDAVVALLQVKSPPEVASDFLELIEKYENAPDGDPIISSIFSMFYWLGISPQQLSRRYRLQGYSIRVLYKFWFKRTMPLPGKIDPKIKFFLTPPADPELANTLSVQIVEKMLDLFERNNANQSAQHIISIMPIPDTTPNRAYLLPYSERINHAIESGINSADKYVRHRAKMLKSR